MEKDLDGMNNEELSKLFPVFIAEPDPAWSHLFKMEEEKIKETLGKDIIIQIDHIGSTAIPGMPAKPTIDILIQVYEDIPDHQLVESLRSIGYYFIHRPDSPPPHMMFAKGYTPEGVKGQTYHLHIRYDDTHDEIIFRDYLVSHPNIARNYAELKYRLAQKYRYDRDAYTEAKTEFIKSITGNP
jgi:GrpB-like predicted nucleotidyltransferase (UPF0157 family)